MTIEDEGCRWSHCLRLCFEVNKAPEIKKKGLLTNDEYSTMPYSVFVYRIISRWMAMSDSSQIRA